MRMYDILNDKKNKKELNKEQIDFWINGVCDGSIPDYQTSALLMAILLNGMSEEETYYLTLAMLNSGEKIDLSRIDGITCDKHSTGGVGDSATFVILPVLAAIGLKCAKMSGRALGHTGGTLDKLETITGFQAELDSVRFIKQVNDINLAVIGQSYDICPADKILYALRDVTATVDSIPLIAGSIMSKKLAGGSDVIVLDVKCGSGAFLKSEKEAEKLANISVRLSKRFGKKISAVITDMNEPLDDYIGNSLELYGAVKVLLGEKNELYEVSKGLATEIIKLSGILTDEKDISKKIDEVLENKSAFNKFVDMVAAQGGDTTFLTDNQKLIGTKFEEDVIINGSGWIEAINTEKIGVLLCNLGAGRNKIEDKIDHFAGIRLDVKIGDRVEKNQIIGKIYTNNLCLDAIDELLSAIILSDKKTNKKNKIIKIIK